jgi:hypothetical protein
LRETQKKLGFVCINKLLKGDDRETPTIKLNKTLSGKRRKVVVAPSERVVMKFYQAPKATSRKQAANQLLRTQKLLSNASFKRNSSINDYPAAQSITNYPSREEKKHAKRRFAGSCES